MTTPAQPEPTSAQQVQDALNGGGNQPPAQTDPTQQVQPEQQPPVNTPESQALYADYLNELPETVRPLAESAFKKWDADVTRRFQELHSQYDPWKPVIEAANPDDVAGALQVANVLEQDPERFLRAFAESFPDLVQGVLGQQQQQQQTPASTDEQGLDGLDPSDPLVQRITQLEGLLQQAVGGFQGFTEQQQQQENQKILDQTLADLHTQHGDFDDTYVLSQMAFRGLTPEQAVTEFKNNVLAKYGQPQPQQQQQQQAPNVLTPGGGLPATPINVAELSDKDTKALVAQLLDNANNAASG